MNLVKTENLTMDSLEIARLTNKEHKNVIRDIRSMFIQLYWEEYIEKNIPEKYRNRHSEYIRENADSIFNAILWDGSNWSHQNKWYSWERDSRWYISKFILNKEFTLTLISGYSIKLRKAIIDRWQELENQNNKPKTFEEIMKDALLLADQRVKQLEAQIEEDKPKVNFADAVWNTENCILMRDFCKMLNEKWVKIWQNRLYSWLRRKWYLMENNRPYQKYAHYFPVKERLINSCNWEMLQLTTYINWKWQAFLFTKLENEAEFK